MRTKVQLHSYYEQVSDMVRVEDGPIPGKI